MDFIPKADWQWMYNHKLGLLTVVNSACSFPLSYQANMLRFISDQNISFTIDDVTRYIELFESEQFSSFDEALRCKLILHILAIDLFHKPIMPKSWLFADAQTSTKEFQLGDRVSMTAAGYPNQADYIVIEQEANFYLCMLLDETHQFANDKVLEQCQLVKVTKDKINECKFNENQHWRSFLNVG